MAQSILNWVEPLETQSLNSCRTTLNYDFTEIARTSLSKYIERSSNLLRLLRIGDLNQIDSKILSWKASYYNFKVALYHSPFEYIEDFIDPKICNYDFLDDLEQQLKDEIIICQKKIKKKIQDADREKKRISNYRLIAPNNRRLRLRV